MAGHQRLYRSGSRAAPGQASPRGTRRRLARLRPRAAPARRVCAPVRGGFPRRAAADGASAGVIRRPRSTATREMSTNAERRTPNADRFAMRRRRACSTLQDEGVGVELARHDATLRRSRGPCRTSPRCPRAPRRRWSARRRRRSCALFTTPTCGRSQATDDVSRTTEPRTTFGTVVVAVARMLVPNCSDATVTKTAQ